MIRRTIIPLVAVAVAALMTATSASNRNLFVKQQLSTRTVYASAEMDPLFYLFDYGTNCFIMINLQSYIACTVSNLIYSHHRSLSIKGKHDETERFTVYKEM